MTNQLNFNFKKSLIALMVTTSVGGLTLGFTQQAQSSFSSNKPYQIAQSSQASMPLKATASKGTPEGYTEQEWKQAQAKVTITDVNNDTYTVKVEASGLVPDGLYTLWWVEDQMIGKAMGPAGGTPENEFRADSNGNASTTITVPADNRYDMMGIAYHADDQTHGDKPGKMGETAFRHLMGKFIKPSN